MSSEFNQAARDVFRLLTPSRNFSTAGIRTELERGDATTLGARVARFFATKHDGVDRLVGAMPFDRAGHDYLYQPNTITAGDSLPVRAARAGDLNSQQWLVSAEPPAEDYGRAVSRALDMMEASKASAELLRKVVLSRSLNIRAPRSIDLDALMQHLAQDRSINAFQTPLPGGSAALVGASPELLVSRKGREVVSHPLAGSARRYADPARDRESAKWLENSDKNQREHREVIGAITDILAPYCSDIQIPDGTTLRATATMWHLGTRIVATLKDEDTSAADLAAALHPTPAVCGMPRLASAKAITELEEYDRGFYAGAVGWVDRSGDGEWYVALRCAEVDDRNVRLYAGAGIVPGSEPEAEIDETSAKFLAMLTALGIDESGRPLREIAA
jgi:isochorismate synthase